MKKYLKYLTCVFMMSYAFSVGEAGAIFLLINPGAGPAGSGEAQVAKANDAYASYYNPAGLGFLKGSELVLQHVNWLPNLADDIFYEFLAYRNHIKGLGTLGGHIIYLNLGEQTQTDELGNKKGLFKSYMMAFNLSYGTQISQKEALGVNFKVFHQKLAESSVVNESGDPFSTDFAFDIGYLRKIGKKSQHSFGLNIQNIGPPIDFIDSQQADPAPTNMKFGFYTELFNDGSNSLHMLFDANKLLVGTYPAMDWNGDGVIMGEDEVPHSDDWYKGIFTAWLDDWYYGGDYDLCEGDCLAESPDEDLTVTSNLYGSYYRDDRIGGFREIQQDIVKNEDVYELIEDVYNTFSYSLPKNDFENIKVGNAYFLCDGDYDCNDDGIVDNNDIILQNGFCDAGEECNSILLNNVSLLSDLGHGQQSNLIYHPYLNQNGFTCFDAISGVNDNYDSSYLNSDTATDNCGATFEEHIVNHLSDWINFSWNGSNSFAPNASNESWCVDLDNNGYCDMPAFDDELDFNGDGVADCENDGNDFCVARYSGYCSGFEFIGADGTTVYEGEADDDHNCKNYYNYVQDNSVEDAFSIPVFMTDPNSIDFNFNGGDPTSPNFDINDLGDYINNHTFNLCSEGVNDSGYCGADNSGELDSNQDGFLDNYELPSKNFYDWYSEVNNQAIFIDSDPRGIPVLTLNENQNIYIPNYRGFCDDIYTSYESTINSNGVMGSSHGYSLCYDQEGDSYYKPANLGTFKDPQWEYLLNDDFQQVSWIDIPHDGLGQFDKYDVMCGDKDHNGSLDSDAYYCSGDDINYLGITEEYKIMNVNNAGIPWDENNIADCTQAPYNEQPGICDEFLTDNIEILDLVSDDENWVHTNATQDGNADVNGDGILDLEAYFYDSDEDVGYNYRQPNHDIDVDGSDQYANGGYDFNNNKYGYYNAYGNYEKGSGDDRKFTDELEEMIYNMGFEYQYSETFIMRFGFIYDLEGEVKNPTFGAGLKFDKYGFDFGYTAGNDDDARSETMFLSISLGL